MPLEWRRDGMVLGCYGLGIEQHGMPYAMPLLRSVRELLHGKDGEGPPTAREVPGMSDPHQATHTLLSVLCQSSHARPHRTRPPSLVKPDSPLNHHASSLPIPTHPTQPRDSYPHVTRSNSIPSHPIPSHPISTCSIPAHPTSSHPIRCDPICSDPIRSHLLRSDPIPSPRTNLSALIPSLCIPRSQPAIAQSSPTGHSCSLLRLLAHSSCCRLLASTPLPDEKNC